MELWWIGPDGAVHDANWYDTSGWHTFTLPGAGPGSASPSSGIAAVSRIPNSMELWWIELGAVHDAYWYDPPQQWTTYTLPGTGTASPSSGIAAVSRIPNSMELWWIGPDGAVHDAYWYDGMTQFDTYTLPGAGPGSASPSSGIAAVSRIPNSMELWWIEL